jgi:hypothetical protein
MSKTEELLELVHRTDFQEIEFARDQVHFADLSALAAAYPALESWDQKAALINLIQDHLDPRFRPLMLDFLAAPDTRGDDVIPLTKAIALCHLDENFDDFMRYYNDPRLIQARADEYLRKNAISRGAPRRMEEPVNAAPQKARASLQIFVITAIIVGGALLLLRAINLNSLNEYRQRGISTQARVTDKWREDDALCLGVSYFDKDLLEGGELYLTEICDFTSAQVWDPLRVDSRVEVVFLPEDPANNTILAASLEDENLAPINRYPLGWVVLGLGLVAWAGYFAVGRLQSKQVDR